MAEVLQSAFWQVGQMFRYPWSNVNHIGGKNAVRSSDLHLYTNRGVLTCPYNNSAVQDLYTSRENSTFGGGNEHFIDMPAWRAMSLQRNAFACNWHPSSAMLERIKRVLFQQNNAEDLVQSQLHSMEIYGPGDFKTHISTSQYTTSHFGSLVVCLPTDVTGGEMRNSTEDGTSEYLDLGSQLGCGSNHIAWEAYLAGADHAVEPVLSGYRITLTYNLFSETLEQTPMQLDELKRHPAVHELELLLRHDAVLKEWKEGGDRALYFALNHAYPVILQDGKDTDSSISHGRTPPPGATWLQRTGGVALKGRDAALFQLLDELGLQPEVVVFTTNDVLTGGDKDERDFSMRRGGRRGKQQGMEGSVTYFRRGGGNGIPPSFKPFHDETWYPEDEVPQSKFLRQVMAVGYEVGLWCTEVKETRPLACCAKYGNETGIAKYHGNFCIRASVPSEMPA